MARTAAKWTGWFKFPNWSKDMPNRPFRALLVELDGFEGREVEIYITADQARVIGQDLLDWANKA